MNEAQMFMFHGVIGAIAMLAILALLIGAIKCWMDEDKSECDEHAKNGCDCTSKKGCCAQDICAKYTAQYKIERKPVAHPSGRIDK
jgi:hypothetical protein